MSSLALGRQPPEGGPVEILWSSDILIAWERTTRVSELYVSLYHCTWIKSKGKHSITELSPEPNKLYFKKCNY